MEIRLVKLDEIDLVMDIINDAKELLSKNSSQWQNGYPNKEVIINDIQKSYLYGIYEGNALLGVEALIQGIDLNYLKIYDGKWINEPSSLDLVIHRIAVKKEYHSLHLGEKLIEFSKEEARRRKLVSLKADTHRNNEVMQHLLSKLDFNKCGIILLNNGEEDNSRLAYEFIL